MTDLAEICLALYEKERFLAFSTREETFMYTTDISPTTDRPVVF